MSDRSFIGRRRGGEKLRARRGCDERNFAGFCEGFKVLLAFYFCKNQMIIKQTNGQMVSAVWFHPEKSFEV